jgi:protein subunit release factor A
MKLMMSAYVRRHIHREKNEFEIQTFLCGGNGGQNKDKTSSGVRIIDTKTGLRSECREERDQLQNKRRAFEKLVLILLSHYQAEEARLRDPKLARNDAVVRTYNEVANRVVDHRTDFQYTYDRIIDGKDLSKVIQDCLEADHGL